MRKDWVVKKLGDVCKFSQGIQVDLSLQSTEQKENRNRFLRITDYTIGDIDKRFVDKQDLKYYVYPDDIVIVRYGASAGFVGINKEGILANNLFKLNHDKTILNYKFLYYCLSTDYYKKFIQKLAFGAAMPALSFSTFKDFNIPVPPLQTQHQIVEELDCLTSIIEKQKKQLEELDNLAQSIFYDMFGDPIENEKGWETSTIDNVCSSIIRGPFGSALKKEFFVEKDDSTYKVYEQKNAINKNAFIGEYYISKEMYKSLSRFEVFPNDIIMSCSGTIGELFVIPNEAERGIINQALLKFTLNKKIEQDYFLFMMDLMKAKLDVKGCGIQNIGSVKYIKTTTFGLPPLPLQEEFASKIEAIEKQKELIKKSIKETEDLFNSRMDYYFN